jgi:hypothetical protein
LGNALMSIWYIRRFRSEHWKKSSFVPTSPSAEDAAVAKAIVETPDETNISE